MGKRKIVLGGGSGLIEPVAAVESVQSRNAANIRYSPIKQATRKGAHERIVGHEWRCLGCNVIIHTEGLVGVEQEEHEEVAARQLRIAEACQAHDPCPREKPKTVYTSEAEEDDEASLTREEWAEEESMMREEQENEKA